MNAMLLLQIISPATDEQYEQARNLIRAFIDWHSVAPRGYYTNKRLLRP
jgi:hypothetical protein